VPPLPLTDVLYTRKLISMAGPRLCQASRRLFLGAESNSRCYSPISPSSGPFICGSPPESIIYHIACVAIHTSFCTGRLASIQRTLPLPFRPYRGVETLLLFLSRIAVSELDPFFFLLGTVVVSWERRVSCGAYRFIRSWNESRGGMKPRPRGALSGPRRGASRACSFLTGGALQRVFPAYGPEEFDYSSPPPPSSRVLYTFFKVLAPSRTSRLDFQMRLE